MTDEQRGSESGMDRFFRSKRPFDWGRVERDADDHAAVPQEEEDAVLRNRISELLDDIADPEFDKRPTVADNGVRAAAPGAEASHDRGPRYGGEAAPPPAGYPASASAHRPAGDGDGGVGAEMGVSIKGRDDSVAIEIGAGQWQDLVRNLDVRLDQAANFFRGGQVSLGLGGRPLLETELSQLWKLLERYGLTLGIVSTSSDRTFQSALNLGLSATLDAADPAQRTSATGADSNRGVQTHFVYRGSLRSGQVLQKSENVLIIGDVNPGGHVVSAGDILVWGRLRGVAHAGSGGNGEAIIGALQLESTQLRIAHLIAVPNAEGESASRSDTLKPAEIAYVSNGQIVVSNWRAARHGFRSVLLG